MVEVIYDEVGSSLELSEVDRGERVEMMVDIYESSEAVRVQETSMTKITYTEKETTTQQTGRGGRCSRLAAVCLGLLCVLLLITIILIYMYYVNVKEEKDSLSKQISSLRENFTAEREITKSSIRNLTEIIYKYDHLLKQIKIVHSNEWKKFGSSFYFFPSDWRTWNESRKDCRERGADLVIINSEEEQAFLVDRMKTRFWIGLTDAEVENTWKWVNGQLLTEGFWRKGEPNDAGGQEDCAIFTATAESYQDTWNDLPCSNSENWVCEFNLTQFII